MAIVCSCTNYTANDLIGTYEVTGKVKMVYNNFGVMVDLPPMTIELRYENDNLVSGDGFYGYIIDKRLYISPIENYDEDQYCLIWTNAINIADKMAVITIAGEKYENDEAIPFTGQGYVKLKKIN